FNLSSFVVFDVITTKYSKLCLEYFIKYGELRKVLPYLETKREFLDEIKNNKVYYETFKDLINIEKIFISKFDYVPINQRVIEKRGYNILNLYEVKTEFSGIKPNIKSKFPYIKEFLLNIWGQNKEMYNKFLEVCSWKLQNPLERLSQTNFIIQDSGGTGLSEILFDLIL
ncbi:MAG: hypothetical protein ACTSRG_22720, partial [Candidatus Helarchaeota archaeon]